MKQYFLSGNNAFYADNENDVRYAEGIGYEPISQAKAYDICNKNRMLNKDYGRGYFTRVHPIVADYDNNVELEKYDDYEYRIKSTT